MSTKNPLPVGIAYITYKRYPPRFGRDFDYGIFYGLDGAHNEYCQVDVSFFLEHGGNKLWWPDISRQNFACVVEWVLYDLNVS